MDIKDKKFNKYILEEEIGRGGFGTVYRAIDSTLDRPVALKVLEPALTRDMNWVTRFRREAKLMAKLDHPNIVPIYETSEENGRLFIAMKLIDGRDLSKELKENGRFSWDETVRIITQVADALEFAHQQGIVHRDLKPGNVILGSKGAILTDFGFARLVGDHSMSMSLSGGVIGTPSYLAPEVWEGSQTGVGTDIYAMGCILYEMVMGKTLFAGESVPAIMTAHFRPPALPEQWPDDVPTSVTQVIETALMRDIDARYATAKGMMDALTQLHVDNLAEPYVLLETAVAAKQWVEALTIADEIRAQDANYRDVAALEEKVFAGQELAQREEWAAQWQAQAETEFAAGNMEAARLAAQKWKEMGVGETAVVAFLAKLDEAISEPVVEPDIVELPTPEVRPHSSQNKEEAASASVTAIDKKHYWGWAGAIVAVIIACIGISLMIGGLGGDDESDTHAVSEPDDVSAVVYTATATKETIYTATATATRKITRVTATPASNSTSEELASSSTATYTPHPTKVPTLIPTVEPATLYVNWGDEPVSLDPTISFEEDIIRNLFVGLTQVDHETGEVLPYLASSWSAGRDSDGKQTWTFSLRQDIPWVIYDPTTGNTTQLTDSNGNPRWVNAQDVVYSIQRALDPDTGADYAYILYDILNATSVNDGTLAVSELGVTAVSDWSVRFTLADDAGHFPSIVSVWVAYPVPREMVEDWEDKWTEAGLIATSGPYVLSKWTHGSELNLRKNPLWAEANKVQIEYVNGLMINEASTALAMYENNELDIAGVPSSDTGRVQSDSRLSQELYKEPRACTYYYGFTLTKYPMTDIRVRRALVRAIDRESLIENIMRGGQIPATSFAPPGMFGAPAPGEVGLSYSPVAAQSSLQSFLNDEGLTIDDFNNLGVTLMHNTSDGHASIAAAIQQMWKDTLGIDIRVENQEWKVYLSTIYNDTSLNEMPDIWRLGWCADYPDENNWVYDVYSVDGGSNSSRRNHTEFDDLVELAMSSTSQSQRAAAYYEAERILAAEEVAYIPIYHYGDYVLIQPWLSANLPVFGGWDIFNWTIDAAASSSGR